MKISPEALEVIEEKRRQLKVNLLDVVNRKASLQAEISRLGSEEVRLLDMLKALEKEFPEVKPIVEV